MSIPKQKGDKTVRRMNAPKHRAFTYIATYSIDLSKVSKPFGELFDEINKTLLDFGVSQQLNIRASAFTFCMTFPKRLTEEGKARVLPALTNALREYFPDYDVQLADFKPQYKVRPRVFR